MRLDFHQLDLIALRGAPLESASYQAIDRPEKMLNLISGFPAASPPTIPGQGGFAAGAAHGSTPPGYLKITTIGKKND
ncbi:MAG: hypothetical protein ABIK15_03675 [Pseudomonadota bacterium]